MEKKDVPDGRKLELGNSKLAQNIDNKENKNDEGKKFMESKYDTVINTNEEEFQKALEKAFEEFEK